MNAMVTRLGEAYSAQVDLWERYLGAMRPWERDPKTSRRSHPLRWARTPFGWKLRGTRLP